LIVSELATIYSALKQGRLPKLDPTAVLQGYASPSKNNLLNAAGNRVLASTIR